MAYGSDKDWTRTSEMGRHHIRELRRIEKGTEAHADRNRHQRAVLKG